MMRLTSERIAEVAMVGVAKVKKDISKGLLDSESLKDILRYVQGHRMLASGLKVWDGVMFSVAEDSPRPDAKPVLRSGTSTGLGIDLSLSGSLESQSEWSAIEEEAIGGMAKFGKSRVAAEREIKKGREHCGVERLGASDLDELGWG